MLSQHCQKLFAPDPSMHAGVTQFGAIDIDSELVAFKESTDGKGQIMMLNNGCLCCTVMGDLLDMLQDLVRSTAMSLWASYT